MDKSELKVYYDKLGKCLKFLNSVNVSGVEAAGRLFEAGNGAAETMLYLKKLMEEADKEKVGAEE